MKARHSVTLLGLKPSNMRPVHQQYRTYDPQQMTASQQTLSQVNPQETAQQQQAAQAAIPSQTANPDTENVQRSIFLQDHVSSQQPQQFRLEQRKFPDLRPLSSVGQSSPIVAKSDTARTSMVRISIYFFLFTREKNVIQLVKRLVNRSFSFSDTETRGG